MQVIILCGGKGTRMGKDLDGLPKALIPIGKKAIIWHIMKYYACYGHNDFILCLGHKKKEIAQYVKMCSGFRIKLIDTGLETNTGGRLKIVEKHVKNGTFFVTYGDGLSNVNLRSLLMFHRLHGRIASLTAVKPRSYFGIVGIDSHSSAVTHFDEKPILDHWINGGFFVFNKGIFKKLRSEDILEKQCFKRLVEEKELVAYKHIGFWECMDTYKDNLRLNELWGFGKAPWRIWRKGKNG